MRVPRFVVVTCLVALTGCANTYHMVYAEQHVQPGAGSPTLQTYSDWRVRTSIKSPAQHVPMSDQEQQAVTRFSLHFNLPCSSQGYQGYDHEARVRDALHPVLSHQNVRRMLRGHPRPTSLTRHSRLQVSMTDLRRMVDPLPASSPRCTRPDRRTGHAQHEPHEM
jgi:hypothetical protein